MLGARLIPRLRHTIHVRDDRLPSQPRDARYPLCAVASAAGLGGLGARYPIYMVLIDFRYARLTTKFRFAAE